MSTIEANGVADRVARGAALLDERLEADWASRIDVSGLDMGSSCGCILGQIYGDFATGLYNLFDEGQIARDVEIDFGFERNVYVPWGDDSDSEYTALAEAWVAEIRQRTGGAS